MKAVLASIRPQHCENIIFAKKRLELRKNKPGIPVPFKVYIYETKGKTDVPTFIDEEGHEIYQGRGQIIGEFVCDTIDKYIAEFTTDNCYEDIRMRYYDEDSEDYEDNIITSNEYDNPSDCWLCKKSCLSFDEIKKYVFNEDSGFFDFYGWHISDLIIYDKPKELSEFHFPEDKFCEKGLCGNCPKYEMPSYEYGEVNFDCEWKRPLTRPPQSWCYVEEINRGNK